MSADTTWITEQFERERRIRKAIPRWLIASIAGPSGVRLFDAVAPDPDPNPEA